MRGAVRALLALGYPREAVKDALIRFVDLLRETGREAAEEPVIDAFNDLVGWCSPHMKL